MPNPADHHFTAPREADLVDHPNAFLGAARDIKRAAAAYGGYVVGSRCQFNVSRFGGREFDGNERVLSLSACKQRGAVVG